MHLEHLECPGVILFPFQTSLTRPPAPRASATQSAHMANPAQQLRNTIVCASALVSFGFFGVLIATMIQQDRDSASALSVGTSSGQLTPRHSVIQGPRSGQGGERPRTPIARGGNGPVASHHSTLRARPGIPERMQAQQHPRRPRNSTLRRIPRNSTLMALRRAHMASLHLARQKPGQLGGKPSLRKLTGPPHAPQPHYGAASAETALGGHRRDYHKPHLPE